MENPGKLSYFVLLMVFISLAFGILTKESDITTDEVAVVFDCKDSSCDLDSLAKEFAEKHNLAQIRKIESINTYLFRIHQSIRDSFEIRSIENEENVLLAERQVLRRRFKRIEILDPLYPNQWHININNGKSHVNVEGAWQDGYTGEGVTIAVVDDGIETSHEDLAENYIHNASYNFNSRSDDVNPVTSSDYHGTSVAGCAGARDDGRKCGVGVAYRAGLSGLVLLQAPVSDSIEAEALQYALDINDIYSNSWGPYDDAKELVGPGPLTKLALEHGSNNGRDGKGAIYVWAAGNGGNKGDNCNYDGYASWRKAMTISSVKSDGTYPTFSENCSSILAVTPSGVTTTRINNTCTNSFSGTSASAPIGAGVIALILQANPNLNWLDVQRVIVETSTKIDSNHSDWVLNGGGHWVSHKYGYGLMDTTNAVKRAIELGNEPSMSEVSITYLAKVNSAFSSYKEYNVNVFQTFLMHHLEVEIDLKHPKSGQLRIEVVSPSGTISVLAEYHNDIHPNIKWTYTSKMLWGETSFGTWKLIINQKELSSASMNSFKLKMYGTPNVEIDTDKYFEVDIDDGGNSSPVPVKIPNESQKVEGNNANNNLVNGILIGSVIVFLLIIILSVSLLVISRVFNNDHSEEEFETT